MKEKTRKVCGRITYDMLAAVIATVIALVLHILDVLFGWNLPGKAFLWVLLLVMYGLMVCDWIGLKRMLIGAVAVVLTVGGAIGSLGVGWLSFCKNGDYQFADEGKASIYAGRRVMLIVPHQDDEVNLLGGVIEEYVRYGSEVYVVFATNGDYGEIPTVRYFEALSVLGNLGVPEERVIFLGYGDQYAEAGPHLYNAPAGEVITSHFGRTETYGAEFHSAYREGRVYTSDNFLDDIQSVILEYRPEILICSDYDAHSDHKALTLAFDKVMGRMLREVPEYYPTVYKGYAYSTAWFAVDDYYAENIASTREASAETGARVYRWEDKIRFPVDGGTLSRSLLGSTAYRSLNGHNSQYAYAHAGRVINGDRVFWKRAVNSLCLDAQIDVSSGSGELLNDFMLLENYDVVDANRKPYDGVWIPDVEDEEKTAKVVLTEPADLYSIVLYDHPAPDQNVMAVEITFDDGSRMCCENLDSAGAATVIPLEKENIASFTVKILSAEGTGAGLTEIEAFAEAPAENGRLLKLMDENEDFVYDYWTNPDGDAVLRIYSYGLEKPVDPGELTVTVSNPKCETYWEEECLLIHCPRGQETQLRIVDATGELSDQVVIRNPRSGTRLVNGLYQWLEKRVFDEYNGGTFDVLLKAPVTQWTIEKARMLKYYLAG